MSNNIEFTKSIGNELVLAIKTNKENNTDWLCKETVKLFDRDGTMALLIFKGGKSNNEQI